MSFSDIVLALVAIVAVWYIYNVIYSIFFSPLRAIPSPLVFQLLPGYIEYHLAKGTCPKALHPYHEKYGNVFRIGWKRVVFVDPSAPMAIYGNYNFEKGNEYDSFNYFGVNLVTSYHRKAHSKRKRLIAPAFTRAKLNAMIPGIISKGVKPLLENMKNAMEKDGQVDLFHQFHLMTWDIIGDLAFGQSFNMLQTGDHPAVGWMGGMLNFISVCYAFPFLSTIRIPSGENLRSFFHDIMSKYYAQHVEGTSKLISSFVDEVDKETGDRLSKDDILSEAFLLLLAGADTSSNALTFIFHNLVTHPDCYKNVQAELDSADDITDHTKLPYLEAVVKESLRVCPPAPNLLFRYVPDSGSQIAGYHLPPGTEVSVSTYSLHRSKNFWLHPDSFMPERWLDSTNNDDTSLNYLKSGPKLCSPSCFVPFSSGPRGCIGKDLAIIEMILTTASLLKNFDFELPLPIKEIDWVALPVMRPKDSKLFAKVTKRKKNH